MTAELGHVALEQRKHTVVSHTSPDGKSQGQTPQTAGTGWWPSRWQLGFCCLMMELGTLGRLAGNNNINSNSSYIEGSTLGSLSLLHTVYIPS